MMTNKEEVFITDLQIKVEANPRNKLAFKEEAVKKDFKPSNLAQSFNLKE